MEKIDGIAQFEQLLEEKEAFFLLKHSTTCPVSAAAFDEYQAFLNAEETDQKGYYLAVQDSRELSNHIAEMTDIRHESPQVIFFKEGKPEWNESHWKITKNNLASIR
jgi:bacillithiol system protein YtxJ